MKSAIRALAVSIAAVSATSSCFAYEVDTHAAVASTAFDQAAVAQSSTQARLGFDRLDSSQPYAVPGSISSSVYPYDRNSYFDVNPGIWTSLGAFGAQGRRSVQKYEQAQMPGPFRLDRLTSDDLRLTMKAWFMRGVIREDDLTPDNYDAGEVRPDADPYGDFVRVLHHFFDPVLNRQLVPYVFNTGYVACDTIPLVNPSGYASGKCVRATDWGMGRDDAASLISPRVDDSSRRNHFSWADAREAYYCALTYNGSSDRAANSADRRVCLATAIGDLGHVSHLLQDMSQPQHVRDDPHSPPNGTYRDSAIATDMKRRTFEIWTNFRATNGIDLSSPPSETETYRTIFGSTPFTPLALATGYPIPRFSTPVKFFTTRQIEQTSTSSPDPIVLLSRRGLADFTNRSFFSEGTIQSAVYPLPPSDSTDSGYTVVRTPLFSIPGLGTVFELEQRRAFVDILRGSYVDAPLAPYGGLVPLASKGLWADFAGPTFPKATISLRQYSAHADVLLPRAIAYTTGLIDHFFRGKLEVTSPGDKVIGVVNQGSVHNVIGGYPYLPSSPLTIFGFQKIRLKIRNATDPVVESGTGESFPQYLGTPGGVGDPKGSLVAVARYHRNPCYKTDLSGERVQVGASPNTLIIEPTCVLGGGTRTGYEEISVSAPMTVTAADLDSPSELDNLAAGTGIEKVFDFTADPIPVNATDLFIQVVYRGRIGKEHDAAGHSNNAEFDGIATGIIDVREPTFVAFWDNSDYFWNSADWLLHNASFPNKSAKDFWICAGGSPVKLIFLYTGANGSPAMKDPVVSSNTPGMVRLGILFPPQDFAGQARNVRGTPVTFSQPDLLPRSVSTFGRIVQANRDQISQSTLSLPFPACATTLPLSTEYWCNDPVAQKRGQVMGSPFQPIYLETSGASTPRDVDSAPILPTFAGVVPLAAGDLRFETDATLQACPAPISSLLAPEQAERMTIMELIEEANDLGIDVGAAGR